MPHTRRKKARVLAPTSYLLKDGFSPSAAACSNAEARVEYAEQTTAPELSPWAYASPVPGLAETEGTSLDMVNVEQEVATAMSGGRSYVGSVSYILNQLKSETEELELEGSLMPASSVLDAIDVEPARSPAREAESISAETEPRGRLLASSISFLLNRLRAEHEKPEEESVVSEERSSGSPFPSGPASNEEQALAGGDSSAATQFPLSKQQEGGELEEATLLKKYNWPPRLLQAIVREFQPPSPPFNNFLKMCKWSTDGGNLITASEDCRVRLFRLFEKKKNKYSLLLSRRLPTSDCVYDCCWSPSASAFVIASRNCPVNMYDDSGEKIAHYTPIDYKDEMARAVSVAIDNDSSHLYAGCNKFVYEFDVSRPGRQTLVIPTWQKRAASQPGIISCFAFPRNSVSSFFAGSYSGWALYDSHMSGSCMLFQANLNGVTQMAMSSCGRYLFTGGRMDDSIYCWDVRVMPKLLCTLRRRAKTQQRIGFELSRGVLVSGTSDGSICLWTEPHFHCGTLEPISETCISRSAVNGVSLNSNNSLIATCSGERMSLRIVDDMLETEATVILKHRESDNALKLWSL